MNVLKLAQMEQIVLINMEHVSASTILSGTSAMNVKKTTMVFQTVKVNNTQCTCAHVQRKIGR